jgi:hypothetical protein
MAIVQDFNWNKLQNGSDIRGIALEGVKDEHVNLTPAVAKILGQAFATWLAHRNYGSHARWDYHRWHSGE